MTFINIQHIDCYCNKGYKAAFSSAIGDFYLFYDEPVDMQIWAPLTRSHVESVTQVTFEACGPCCSSLYTLIYYDIMTRRFFLVNSVGFSL